MNTRNKEESNKEQQEDNFMSEGWKWELWEKFQHNDAIKSPVEEDCCNGPHKIRPGVTWIFVIKSVVLA